MIPVNQTIVDKGRGDCFRAASASLLDLEIIQVPHFILFGTPGWQPVFLSFFRCLGWRYYGVVNFSETESNDIPDENTINGFTMASVPSRNFVDVSHSVVIDTSGLVVHDPHPGKSYQGENVIDSGVVDYWYLFEKKEGSA